MLPTDLSIALAQERIRDLLAEAVTSRLAARLRKTGRRPARGRRRHPTRHGREGFGAAAASRS
jgi:ribosomal protein L4